MRVILVVLCIAAVSAVPTRVQKIVGGSLSNIESYPTIAALLYSWNGNNYGQACGGTIINYRAVLTAAHCPHGDPVVRWRVRLGSTWANSGGAVYALSTIIVHPSYSPSTMNNDIAIMRTSSGISYSNLIQPASIAGASYNLADNQVVWAAGWGTTSSGGLASEQLRHVQIWTINQAICKSRYAFAGLAISDNMLCSGVLDVGGRDQCQGDSGGPLYHNGIVVGVCSFGIGCGQPQFPGVNARLSKFTSWIQSHA